MNKKLGTSLSGAYALIVALVLALGTFFVFADPAYATEITKVEIKIAAPEAGAKPATKADITATPSTKTTVKGVTWYKEKDKDKEKQTDAFVAGNVYRVEVQIALADEDDTIDEKATVTVNGKNASWVKDASTPTATFTFPAAPEAKADSASEKKTKSDDDDAKVKAQATHTINVATGIQHGTVTVDKESAEEGDTVKVTATPAANYKLEAITVTDEDGAPVTVDSDGTFTMPAKDVNVIATFTEVAPTTYDVNVATGIEGGGVEVDKTTAAEGDTVKVTATPETDYELDAITVTDEDGDPVTVESDGTFTMPAKDVNVTATFTKTTPTTYNVNVATGIQNGTVTVDKESAAEGDTVKVTATPDSGYELEAITVTDEDGDPVTVESDGTFTMPAKDVNVIATFTEVAPTTYDVKVATGIQNGTVTVDKEKAAEGDTVKVTATPDSGYELDAITATDEDGKSVTVAADGTFTMPASNVEVSATFKKTPSPTTYKVKLTVEGSGSVKADPSEGTTGTEVTLTATPDSGAEFAGWTIVSGTGATISGNKLTIGTSDVEVKATFKSIPTTKYKVTLTVSGPGSVTASPSEGATGTEVNLTATPKSGAEFVRWEIVSGTGATISGNKLTIGTSDVALRGVFQTKTTPHGTPSNPTMSTSAGSNYISRTTEVTYTIAQVVPAGLSSMTITHDLESVMEYTTAEDQVVVRVGSNGIPATVSIDGQRLTARVDGNSVKAGDTVNIIFKARVRSGANLSSYLNTAKTTASIPYKATTTFNWSDGSASQSLTSKQESIKVANSSTSSGTTTSSTNRTSTSNGTLARTADPTSFAAVATAALAGAGMVFVGARKKH